VNLSLQTRGVGRVTIVRCGGRIVAGAESVALREHVAEILLDRRSIVLHMGEVVFIDSSGLGALVRVRWITRAAHGELKLCNLPEHVRKILEMTHLTKVFEAHESEELAVAAFYRGGAAGVAAPESLGKSILCLDSNADVLASLREVLRRAGYEVQTSTSLSDALMLARVGHPHLVLVGSGTVGALAALQGVCGAVPVIELGAEFSTAHAGEAVGGLLERIQGKLGN
jgi:anti-sigma B factor antagonist